MRHQLLTIDLDGTLLNNAGQLTPRTVTTIQRVAQRGHHVILTTGRPDNISVQYYD